MIQGRYVAVVVAAAGGSTRMGRPKQWLPLLGDAVLAHTLCALQASVVDEIVLAVRPEDMAATEDLITRYRIGKVKALTEGGETRQQSVERALTSISDCASLIAVHDGARPLVTPVLVERVAALACRMGAAAPAVPVKDTCKLVDADGRVVDTPCRELLRAVQTPQIFDADVYRRAVKLAGQTGGDYTDDCQLVERLGCAVYLCDGDNENIKITTPEDVLIAEAILRRRREL